MSNLYDEESFFHQYAQMLRSREGLSAAGEWHRLKPLIPQFSGKKDELRRPMILLVKAKVKK